MFDKPMTMKAPEFPLYYTAGTFERDTLKRIRDAIDQELAFSKEGEAVDALHLATAASALTALVNLMKANITAEARGLRLDGALERLKPRR